MTITLDCSLIAEKLRAAADLVEEMKRERDVAIAQRDEFEERARTLSADWAEAIARTEAAEAEMAKVELALPELLAASALAVATIESLRAEVAELRKAQGGVQAGPATTPQEPYDGC